MKQKKTRTGIVVGIGMNKTIRVAVENIARHGLYRKTVRRTKRFLVHFEGTGIQLGDRVTIGETKPISREKRFVVISDKGKHV